MTNRSNVHGQIRFLLRIHVFRICTLHYIPEVLYTITVCTWCLIVSFDISNTTNGFSSALLWTNCYVNAIRNLSTSIHSLFIDSLEFYMFISIARETSNQYIRKRNIKYSIKYILDLVELQDDVRNFGKSLYFERSFALVIFKTNFSP